MEQDIRLVYSATSTQVRVSVPMEAVQDDRRPPKNLYKRAKSKLEDELSKGNLDTFVIYEESFGAYWTYLREKQVEASVQVNFLLAQGFRPYREITLRQKPETKEWLLTVNANLEVLQKIGWPRFSAFIMKQIGLQPYTSPILQARILEFWLRCLKGERIQNRPLATMPMEAETIPSRYAHDKDHGAVFIWLNDANLFRTGAEVKILISRMSAYFEKNKSNYFGYEPLIKECQENLKELSNMPEVMGFGLPIGLPLAIKFQPIAELASKSSNTNTKEVAVPAAKQAKTASKSAGRSSQLANRLIEITVSQNGLEAHISWADDAKLQAGSFDQDKKWLEISLADAGICYGFEPYMDKILSVLTLNQSLKGQLVARGIEAKAGEITYLHPLFLEKTVESREEGIELRAAQNRRVVEIDDVIAEFRFRDGKTGTDVYGKPIYAPVDPGVHPLETGPGAERRSDGRFYAKIRGVPKLERHTVSCLDIYVHKGDINLKSGDLQFDGAVEVTGNIDNGAKVFVKGDLVVRGTIGRSRVRCGGDLDVHKGIVSSREGFVHVGGDAYALFIENSRIIVEGKLEVERSIINSDCKVGNEINILSVNKGLIGGGLVVAKNLIRSANIGFQDGEKTFLRVGSDWQIEHRLTILRGREAKLKKFVFDRQYEFDDLSKKKAMGERIQKAEKRLLKSRKILEKIEKLIETWRNRIRWNDEALVLVRGILDENVEIAIGGRIVNVPKSLKEVMVSAVRYRDQFVNSLIYAEQFRKQRAAQGDGI